MDIKQILKEKIENCEKEEKYGDVFHHEIWYAKADTYRDCANLIEQSEKPMKPIPHSYYHKCPKCGEYLASTYPHCPYCGQPLDWGEGEKK